jgi:hypothetical protein
MKNNPIPSRVRSSARLAVTALVLLLGTRFLKASSAEELYQRGKEAFNQPDYLLAVEHLVVFREVTAGSLDAETVKAVEAAITYSEQQLRTALSTKEALDKYGSVLTIVTDGKVDDPRAPARTKKVSLPKTPAGVKPTLPDKAGGRPKQAAAVGRLRPVPTKPVVVPAPAPAEAEPKPDTDLAAENQRLRFKLELHRKQLERLQDACARMAADLAEGRPDTAKPPEAPSPRNP